MKQFLKRMILMVLLCVPWVMQAQTHYNLQIGSGTATNSYVPSYGYYNYSYSQSLYTAAEVGIDGTIDALSFQVDQNSLSRTLTIYLAEVSQTDLTSSVPESEFQQVFSGTVNFVPGWVTITLDTVFDYQDTGSLIIAVIDGTGSYSYTRPYFTGTNMSETRSRYVYSDYNAYSLSSSLSSSTNFLPNIQLGISSYSTYCAAPSGVEITDINNDEATIRWTENGSATTYELVVSDTALSVADLGNASTITVNDTFYTVTNLAGNTLYWVYVRAVCDATSSSSWTAGATFRSACVGYTTIPYSTGFEDLSTGQLPNCWQQIASGSSSASTFPSAYAYASNARNSGVYFEFESSTGETEIAALPVMDNLSSLMLTFYASCMNTNFVLEAGVMEGSTFVPVQTVQLTPGSGNNWSGSYYPYTVYYGNYSGSGDRMALRVTATGNYTLMMDDLEVDYIPTCPPPSAGSIDSTGSDWVSFSWQENGSATSWEVAYGTGSFVPDDNTSGTTVYDISHTLYGLSGDSAYTIYVRSNCGGDYSSWLEVGTAQPGIYVMTLASDTLYTCGATIFDNGGSDGNYSSNSDNILVVYPSSADSTLRIWGTVNTESGYDYVRIYDGVGTGGTQLYQGSGSANIGPFISLAQAVTIQFTSDASVNYAGFELHTSCVYMSSCTAPLSIAVDSVLGDTVWVSWNDTAYNSTFELVYGPVGFNPDTVTVGLASVNGTSEMVTGLTLGQPYEFYVRSDCGNEQSMWVGPVTATPGYSYVMAATGSDTIHVCGYTIYDDGGESDNYSANCNSTLVVYPSDPTQTIQISGTGYVESGYDDLYIYDGVGTGGAVLYHAQGNFTIPPMNSENGVVTIVFTSDNMIQYSGYELNVSCVPLPSCPHPTQLTVSNIGTQTAELSWTELGTATDWIVQYSTVNFTPGDTVTVSSLMVSTNPYTLTGLDSGMTYYVYVASYCNPDTSSYIGISFGTLASTPASLPYSCNFEQTGGNGWEFINGVQTNRWMVGAGASNGGSQGLYVTDDNMTNNYNTSSTSTVYASRTLNFDSVGEYVYSFDWKANGESTYDYLRAALVPVAVDLVAGSIGSWSATSLPSGAIALDGGNKLNLASSWTNRTGTVNVTNAGAYNLVFFWHNDFSAGSQPPAAVDNVMISRLSCPSPANVAVTRVTFDSVFLAWDGNGSSGPWIVSYGNSTNMVYDTTAAIGGLTSGTLYTFTVATLCGSDTSFPVAVQVTPGSWLMRPNQTDTLYMCGGIIYDDGGANGSYSPSQNSVIILRPDTPSSLVSVSGVSYTEGSWDYLTIYDGEGLGGTELWSDYNISNSVTFGPIESVSGPLTIEFHADGSINNDGFTINVSCVTTSCRVLNLALNDNVSESGSQLAVTWDAVTDALQYQIEYGYAGFIQGQGQMMTSMTNSAVITGLSAMTTYDVYVRSLCAGNDTGSWAFVRLRTAMCDNPVEVFNYDTSQAVETSSYTPIGFSYYNNSYVQTIIPASRLADLTGDVTAIAFNPMTTTGGTYFTNMTVWMSNVSEESFVGGDFIQADATHQFTKVIDSADFSYSSVGWQIQGLETAFAWDGVSNILVTVLREHGSYASGSSFAAHEDTVERVCYYYNDYYVLDPATASGGMTSTTVGDIMLISCGGGCPRPSGLYASNVDYGNATLNWIGSAPQYEVAVKAANEGTWPAEVAVNNATMYNVSGLAAATRYQFRVRAICDVTESYISDWVLGAFVTDSLPCFEPTELRVADLGNTTATLAWTAGEGQSRWSIHVWNSTYDHEYTADGNPFTVTGLTQTTQYNAAVKAICGNGAAESEYGDTIQFTTTSCAQVTGVAVSDVTAHSAVVSWASNGAASYEIEYGDRNFNQGDGTRITVDNATMYTLDGLREDHSYSIFVRAICDQGVYGSWSQQVDFATPEEGAGITAVDGANLRIYPNPTSDVTTIALSGVNGEVRISIVDMNGRATKTITKTITESNTEIRVDVSGLAQGAYFIRVAGDNLNIVKKLVVK